MTIVLLETVHPAAHALLETQGTVHLAPDVDAQTAVSLAAAADAILTRGQGRITRAVLQTGRRLRVIGRCGVGLDNVDVEEASRRGVTVIYAPGSTTRTVAEHTLMLLLAAARRLPTLDGAAKDGQWAMRKEYLGRELGDKTLGVVGLGHIGRRVADLASAFGMRVVTWSPRSRDERYRHMDLDALLAHADMVTLHVRLDPTTRGLIGPRRLALMQPHTILVNTARGALVDEGAVAEALRAGHLSAYATDVLAEEPPGPDHPLLHAPNVVVTPHTAGLTDRAYEAMCVETATNVLRVLRGEPPEPRCVANWADVRDRQGW